MTYQLILQFSANQTQKRRSHLIMVYSSGDKATIETCFLEKGWRGAKIAMEFPGKNWTRNSINRIIKRIEMTGTSDRKQGGGRHATVCTQQNTDYVEEMIQSQEEEPGTHLSQRQIAKNLRVSRQSVQRMAKNLQLKAFKRIKVSRRDGNVKQKRKTRCRLLNDRFTNKDVERIVFSDEKDFTLEIAKNRKNDVVYGVTKKDIPVSRLYHETSRFSKKIMVSAGVSHNGKTKLHFIDTTETKVNSVRYMELLDNGLLPDCRRLYPLNDYIFHQDGAPSHTSKITQAHLEEVTPEFIQKDSWPPQSPDCNPMDYYVWDALASEVYSGRTEKFSERELKDRITECWENITLAGIRKAIGSWKKRLRLVSSEDGGPIDHII